jgi:hypothetical protein
MELESSSPYSQEPATCPYPEPTPSSPHHPHQLPKDPFYYYPPIYVLVSLMAFFPQASPRTPCALLYPPPYIQIQIQIIHTKVYLHATGSKNKLEMRGENYSCKTRKLFVFLAN